MTSIFATLLSALAALPGSQFTHFASFDLGKATLTDVQDQYGASRIRESGDAGEYEAWVCYSVPSGEIQFNSGEMGGGTDLLGFTLSAKKSAEECPKPKKPLPREIGGIKLGISRNQFTSIVNNPVEWSKDTGTSSFEYKSRTSDGVPLDVSISVIATFHAEKLIKLTVWKIEST